MKMRVSLTQCRRSVVFAGACKRRAVKPTIVQAGCMVLTGNYNGGDPIILWALVD